MTLLWLDGCDLYGTSSSNAAVSPTGIVGRKWTTSSNTIRMNPGRTATGNHINFTSGGSGITPLALTTNTTLIAGLAYYCEGEDLQNPMECWPLVFREGTNQSLTLRVVKGNLMVVLGGGALTTYLNKTTRFPLLADKWYYLEMKATCGNAGSYEVRVNGTTVMSGSGVDTQNAAQGYWDNVLMLSSSFAKIHFDDFYLCDGAGSTNNDFLGPMYVHSLLPDGDHNNTWDSGNYLGADEGATDDATTVVSEATSGLLEFTFPNTLAFDNVIGVGVNSTFNTTANHVVRLTANTANTVCTSANYTYNSATWKTRLGIFETDSSGNAFTTGTVNSAAFGIELVS